MGNPKPSAGSPQGKNAEALRDPYQPLSIEEMRARADQLSQIPKYESSASVAIALLEAEKPLSEQRAGWDALRSNLVSVAEKLREEGEKDLDKIIMASPSALGGLAEQRGISLRESESVALQVTNKLMEGQGEMAGILGGEAFWKEILEASQPSGVEKALEWGKGKLEWGKGHPLEFALLVAVGIYGAGMIRDEFLGKGRNSAGNEAWDKKGFKKLGLAIVAMGMIAGYKNRDKLKAALQGWMLKTFGWGDAAAIAEQARKLNALPEAGQEAFAQATQDLPKTPQEAAQAARSLLAQDGKKDPNPEEVAAQLEEWGMTPEEAQAAAGGTAQEKPKAESEEGKKAAPESKGEIVSEDKERISGVVHLFTTMAFIETEYNDCDKELIEAVEMIVGQEDITVQRLQSLVEEHEEADGEGSLYSGSLGLMHLPVINPESRRTQNENLFRLVKRLAFFCKLSPEKEGQSVRDCFLEISKNPTYQMGEAFHNGIASKIDPSNILDTLQNLDYEALNDKAGVEEFRKSMLEALDEKVFNEEELKILNSLDEGGKTGKKDALRLIQLKVMADTRLMKDPAEAVDRAIGNLWEKGEIGKHEEVRGLAIAFISRIQKLSIPLVDKIHQRFSLVGIYGQPDHVKEGLQIDRMEFAHAVELNLASDGINWEEGQESSSHWMKDLALMQVMLRAMERGHRTSYLGQLANAFTREDVMDYTIPGLSQIKPYLEDMETLVTGRGALWMLDTIRFTKGWEKLPSESDAFLEEMANAPFMTLGTEALGGSIEIGTDAFALAFAVLYKMAEKSKDENARENFVDRWMGMDTVDDFIQILSDKHLNPVDSPIHYDLDHPEIMAFQIGHRYIIAKPLNTLQQSLGALAEVEDIQSLPEGILKGAGAWIVSCAPFIAFHSIKNGFFTVGQAYRAGVVYKNFGTVVWEMIKGAGKGLTYPIRAPYRAYQGGRKVMRWTGKAARWANETVRRPGRVIQDTLDWGKAVKRYQVLFPGKNPGRLIQAGPELERLYQLSQRTPSAWQGIGRQFNALTRRIFSPVQSGRELLSDPLGFARSTFVQPSEDLRLAAREAVWGEFDAVRLNSELHNAGSRLRNLYGFTPGEAPFSLVQSDLDPKNAEAIYECYLRNKALAERMGDPAFRAEIEKAAKIVDGKARTEALAQLFEKAGLTKTEANALGRQAIDDAGLLLGKLDDQAKQFSKSFSAPTGAPAPSAPGAPASNPIENAKKLDGLDERLGRNQKAIKDLEAKIAQETDDMERARKVGTRESEGFAQKNEANIKALKGQRDALLQEGVATSRYRDALAASHSEIAQLEAVLGEADAAEKLLAQEIDSAKLANPKRDTDELKKALDILKEMKAEIQIALQEQRAVQVAAQSAAATGRWAKAAEMWGKARAQSAKAAQSLSKGVRVLGEFSKKLAPLKPVVNGVSKLMTVLGTAASAYAAYEAFGRSRETEEFGSLEVAKQEKREGLMYTAEGLSFFAKGGYLVLPVTYGAQELVKRQKETIDMGPADWARSHSYESLLHEFYSTANSASLADAWTAEVGALGEKTFDESVEEGLADKEKIMHRMYKALVAIAGSPQIIQSLNEGKGAEELSGQISTEYGAYHEYFFWNAERWKGADGKVSGNAMSHLTSYAQAREAVADAVQFDALMRIRDAKLAKGEKEWQMGGVNILDAKYTVQGSAKQALSISGFDPMELLGAYRDGLEKGMEEELPETALHQLQKMRAPYLLYLYNQISQNLASAEGLEEADEEKLLLYEQALGHELTANRHAVLGIEAGDPQFFRQALSTPELLRHIGGLEQEASTPYQEYERMHQTLTPAVHALYKAAELFGYRGDETEEGVKAFFSEEAASRHGLYWDGEHWRAQEAGLERDNKMGTALNQETVANLIAFLEENSNDILRHRNTDLFGMAEAGSFQAQVDMLTKALREGLAEGKAMQAARLEANGSDAETLKKQYQEVIEEGVRRPNGWIDLAYRVESESEIRIWRADTKIERRIRKTGEHWQIEDYSHKPLSLAQAVTLANLINSTEGILDKEGHQAGSEKPFAVEDGRIDFDVKGFARPDLSLISEEGMGFYREIGLSLEDAAQALNAWYSSQSILGPLQKLAEQIRSGQAA